ncbi:MULTISPECIES: diguanylate cyclase domain-containing protein [Aminobacterium]|uniref:TackOD1 domain-containing metal-binding protein n=1 Tax=Aminobacterium TaxID=81466 RepID=UPI00257BE793|nr:diguanylate cyclase [Aminobacterium sp. UBA4834]
MVVAFTSEEGVISMEEIRLLRFVNRGNISFAPQDGVIDVDTLEDLVAKIRSVHGVILDGDFSKETVLMAVKEIRKIPETCYLPVFCSPSLDSDSALFTDGAIKSLDQAWEKTADMWGKLNEVDRGSLELSRDFRLLAYLALRQEGLNPLLQPFTCDAYRYPIAEFLGGESETRQWLRNLRDRGLLSQGPLIDRIRSCPKCQCTHLNYIDVCPNCGSIDIVPKEFIHCFTCGRVGPVDDFLQENGYRCPFCGTHLRHLGSDYDHPLESFLCNDCGHKFIEAHVVVDCLSCQTRSDPEELLVNTIHGYRISEKGRAAARVGSIDDVYALLDRLNYVIPAYFNQLLDWMILLNRRYPDQTFSVIGVRFVNLIQVSEKLGRHRASQIVDALAERLRQLIRNTDVTTRTATGILLLLLPMTDEAGASVVGGRILELVNLAETSPKPQFQLVAFSSSQNMREGESASSLLARILGELES